MQILDPEEASPSLAGDWRLIDSETGDAVAVELTQDTIDAYKRRFDVFRGDLAKIAQRLDAEYVAVTTDIPFEDMVLQYLRRGGLTR